MFSSPFSGTFFQWNDDDGISHVPRFSSPFSGTFFQFDPVSLRLYDKTLVFVPFLGDFFSIGIPERFAGLTPSFRPLSRGLFFNSLNTNGDVVKKKFSSPFSGTFFQFAELKQ